MLNKKYKRPDEKLEKTAKAWSGIAMKLAQTERTVTIQREQIKRLETERDELTKHVNQLRPKDNKWGWLVWAFYRDVKRVTVPLPPDTSQHNRIRYMARGALGMSTMTVMFRFESRIFQEPSGEYYLEIIKAVEHPKEKFNEKYHKEDSTESNHQ